MPRSIFSGLTLASAGGVLEVRYPERILPAARAAQAARAHGLETSADGETWSVRSPSFEVLKRFFAQVNGFAAPYPSKVELGNEKHPQLSCVIVVNENIPFVREQQVPSLAANSGRPIEVILVHNGLAAQDPALGSLRSLRSQWGAVAAAYNAGARAARAPHLALFHDDCVIDDPRWIEKCLAALEGGARAVAAEHRRMESIAGVAVPPLPVAKCVPLVMRTADFLASGGFDEFHYIGYEDLDLTLALWQRGMKPAPVELALRHFSGMSSALKYCPAPGLADLFALAALPAGAIRRRFKEFIEQGVRLEGVDIMRIGLDVQLLYVLKKYRGFLADIDAHAFGAATAALERRVTSAAPFDANLVLPRFRELDRALAVAAAA